MIAEARTLGVGLVGAGFMGRCHANAFRNVCRIFDVPFEVELRLLADIDEEAAARNAAELGFARSTGDWRLLTGSDDVDIVAITAPNALHEPIALDAIARGKEVYCEKPLATDTRRGTAHDRGGRSAWYPDDGRLQFPEQPDDRLRQGNDCRRRNRHHHRLPRPPRRELHGKSRRGAFLPDGSGRWRSPRR